MHKRTCEWLVRKVQLCFSIDITESFYVSHYVISLTGFTNRWER